MGYSSLIYYSDYTTLGAGPLISQSLRLFPRYLSKILYIPVGIHTAQYKMSLFVQKVETKKLSKKNALQTIPTGIQ